MSGWPCPMVVAGRPVTWRNASRPWTRAPTTACRDAPPALSSPVLSTGNVRPNVATREAWVGGQPVAIPRRELSLLGHLMRRCGKVVPCPALEGDLYGHLGDAV